MPMAGPVSAMNPDEILMACDTRSELRHTYRYTQYVLFAANIIWPFNRDTQKQTVGTVGSYSGEALAVHKDTPVSAALAADGYQAGDVFARHERTTKVDFRKLTRIIEDVYFNADGSVFKTVSDEFACEDTTPR